MKSHLYLHPFFGLALLACSSTDVVGANADGGTTPDAGGLPSTDASTLDATIAPAGGGFTNRSKDILTMRWGAQVAAMDDGNYLVFGGYYGLETLNDLFTVDAKTTDWKTAKLTTKAPPGARSRGNMVYDADKKVAYLYGGRANGSAPSDDDLHVLDLATLTWTTLTLDTRPSALVGSSMVWNQACACGYLFGGSSKSMLLGETWRFDTTPTPHFTLLSTPNAPDSRFDASWVVVPGEKRALLFGGADGVRGSGTFFNDVWSFDFQTEAWSLLQTKGAAPQARRGAFATLDRTRKRLVIGLGESRSAALDDFATLDVATATWTKLPLVWDTKKEAERVFPLSLQANAHDGWIVGGLNDNFNGTSDGAYSLDLTAP